MKNALVGVVTVAVLLLLVKLGWWQLQRADEKQRLQQNYAERSNQRLQWPLPQQQDVRGYQLTVTGRWLVNQSLLLDNQVVDGEVGYRYLVPLQINADQPLLLVDLGFVAGSRDRQQLPPLPQLPQQSEVTGLLMQPQRNLLSDQLLPEVGQPTRIQALNWAQLSELWQQPVADALLWLQQPQQLGYQRRWQPLNMGPEKHHGYAMQWFGLALAWIVVVAVLWRRRGNIEIEAQHS